MNEGRKEGIKESTYAAPDAQSATSAHCAVSSSKGSHEKRVSRRLSRKPLVLRWWSGEGAPEGGQRRAGSRGGIAAHAHGARRGPRTRPVDRPAGQRGKHLLSLLAARVCQPVGNTPDGARRPNLCRLAVLLVGPADLQLLADEALNLLNVDKQGFDVMDRRTLRAIVDRFDGGPVGLDALAASISEERGTIEDVLEPYLIQQGYLMRTPRGRVATAKTYQHFGLPVPQRDSDNSISQTLKQNTIKFSTSDSDNTD